MIVGEHKNHKMSKMARITFCPAFFEITLNDNINPIVILMGISVFARSSLCLTLLE